MLLQRHRAIEIFKCIAILFKSIGIRGRCDSPEEERETDTRKKILNFGVLSLSLCHSEN